eukprot:gene4326-5415_t
MKVFYTLLVAILAFSVGINASQYECEMCQFAYNVYGDLVDRNSTQFEDLLTIVNAACSFQSPELSVTCQDIASAYASQLIAGAAESQSALSACVDIGKCDGELVGRWNPAKKLKCSACKHIVKAAEHTLDKSIDEGINYAKSYCHGLGPLAHECTKLVGSIFRHVVDALKRHEDANTICKHLHCC